MTSHELLIVGATALHSCNLSFKKSCPIGLRSKKAENHAARLLATRGRSTGGEDQTTQHARPHGKSPAYWMPKRLLTGENASFLRWKAKVNGDRPLQCTGLYAAGEYTQIYQKIKTQMKNR
jgi:hypothetical protein